MKKLLFFSLLIIVSLTLNAQKSSHPFFTGSLSTTFGVNQKYKLSEEGNGPFITPKSILLRTGFGYQFNQRWASSINIGYDHHFSYSINSIPTYASLRYNFVKKSSSAYFIESSYGKMFRLSDKFSNGNYYKIGLGLMSLSSNRWNGLIRLDYHKKRIAQFNGSELNSISLGIGFTFL